MIYPFRRNHVVTKNCARGLRVQTSVVGEKYILRRFFYVIVARAVYEIKEKKGKER